MHGIVTLLDSYHYRLIEDLWAELERRFSVPGKSSMKRLHRRPVTRETIERLRQIRQEILQDRQGKPFEDSTELIRQMREERTRQLMGEEEE